MSAFSVTATSPKGGDYELPPTGPNPAVLVGIIDLGTHFVEYKEGRKEMHMIYLLWELTAAKMSGLKDQNHLIGRDYSLTFGPKSLLRKTVETWFGKSFQEGQDFDLAKLLGQNCLLTIVHNESKKGSTYARIEGVTKPGGMTVPPAKTKPFTWEIASGDEPPDQPWLPFLFGEPLKAKIMRSKEWLASHGQAGADNGQVQGGPTGAASEFDAPADEIPF